MIRMLFFAFSLLFLSACDNEEKAIPLDGNVVLDQEMAIQLTNSSAELLTIDGKQYVLDAYLWRDFMPISPPNGRQLISINWLSTVDHSPIPANIQMIKQYVINGNYVWIANYFDDATYPEEFKMERVSRYGPKWGPDVTVLVVSVLKNRDTNSIHLIKVKNVTIGRTD